MSQVTTVTQNAQTIKSIFKSADKDQDQEYRYSHLLPVFNSARYPPLTPFRHEDPARRALSHPDPLTFLQTATRLDELSPALGTEIEGVNLAKLTSDEKDQLALFVAKRGIAIFRDQKDFIDSGTSSYLEWGKHFGRLHIHPTSGHPADAPEIHLVYRDANTTFNFELDERITTSYWHTDVSYELQPPGLTTFFLLSQRKLCPSTAFN
jgi:sulfonate dioxygenase